MMVNYYIQNCCRLQQLKVLDNMIRKCLNLYSGFFATAFNSNKDYYKILNVKPTATEQQIKKQFRRLAKLYHPDLNKGNQQKFKQLNQAYQILSSQVMKKDYDEARRSHSTGTQEQTYNRNTHYRPDSSRQQQQQNTYRGYQQDYGWRNRGFRQQSIKDMYRKQQQQYFRAYNAKHSQDYEQVLKQGRRANFEHNDFNYHNSRSQENLEKQLNQMLRQNAEKIKITRQSVRRAYQQQQKRRQKQYKQYNDNRKSKMTEDIKDKAWKMAEGIKDNVDGIVKVGKFMKENLDGVVKTGKMAKKLWEQYMNQKKK